MAGKDSMASRIGRPFPAKTGLLYAPQFGKHLVPQLLEREMPKPVPRQKPNAELRRALELLAASRGGCTEAVMIAHGFTVPQMVELVRTGLATAHARRAIAGRRTIEIGYMKMITTIGCSLAKRSQIRQCCQWAGPVGGFLDPAYASA
jgi:hypothetical protein